MRNFASTTLTPSQPPAPPPDQPLPKPPRLSKKQREHAKRTVNMLLLRAHVALTYSPHEGSEQALRYADRAVELAVAHHLHQHRGKAQWYRGEALMSLKRWNEANSAFVGSARAVEGGWREEGELACRISRCQKEKEREKEELREPLLGGKEERRRRGDKCLEKSRKAVRFVD